MIGTPFYRRCIQATAWDSPNVKLAQHEISRGLKPSGRVVVPGVLSWEKLQYKLATYDPRQICESVNAEWYEGAALKLVPAEWLDAAEDFADRLEAGNAPRKGPRHMGVDVGAGGDDSAWAVGDDLGLLALESFKTPDTSVISGFTRDMMRKWDVPAGRVVFDLGGGGQFVADKLRAAGLAVRATGFGKAPKVEMKRAGVVSRFEERRGAEEDAYAYVNRRSEMAWDLRCLLERRAGAVPDNGTPGPTQCRAADGTWWDYCATDWHGRRDGWGVPRRIGAELRRQVSVVPLGYDAEDRFKLIPKQNPKDPGDPNTFRALIGRSPDQFDAVCLLVFGMTHKPMINVAGAG